MSVFEPALEELVTAELAAKALPSCAVTVVADGDIIFERAWGWADRERRIPATEHTPYSLASITKPFTTTALMLEVEAGRISLDDPMDKHLDVPLNPRAFDPTGATVRAVARHRAGLPMHFQFFYDDEGQKRPEPAETIRRYGSLVTPPGERHCYSNLGYGLLERAIERSTRRDYADVIRGGGCRFGQRKWV